MLWPRTPPRAVFGWPLFLAATGVCACADTTAAKIDFARDIRPIFASRCYDCHGTEKPKGGLQLTTLKNALKGGESGEPAIVVGDRIRSPMIQRLTTTEEEDVMPRKGERLTPAQVELIGRWIIRHRLAGRLEHWARRPVRRRCQMRIRPGGREIIDRFILARLERRVQPSPETDRARWLRRVSLDLASLPPTPQEVDAFLADAGDQAFERGVDRLLASSVRRALGASVARPGALRGFARISTRRFARELAVSRLGDPGDERRHAVRPVHGLANCGRPAARGSKRETRRAKPRSADRHRLQPLRANQCRGRHRPEKAAQVFDR